MTTTTTLSDNEILNRVRTELSWDPRVDSTEITAKVKNGIVTLTGFVDTYAKKISALGAIHQISGVLDIADEIEVRPPVREKADQELAQAVRSALVWDVYVPDERIKSTVSGGWVTLEGNVDRWQQREDAARSVERLTGVRGVTNRIEVKPPTVDAAKIRTSIEDALMRRAEREAKHLTIDVKDGVVTLKGSVDSWAEKNAIERLAYYSKGVKRLVNEIKVDPYS
jgi:osmotically-inducible protein OsmY